jgi:hypothetical protein
MTALSTTSSMRIALSNGGSLRLTIDDCLSRAVNHPALAGLVV